MLIGITYDLRQDYLDLGLSEEETAEFDYPETIEAIDKALQDLGYATQRIGNIHALVKSLAEGQRWDMVFNICEGRLGFAREAQVPALLEAWNIPYTFSDPLVLALTLHKGLTKRVIRDLALPTPDFFILESLDQLDDVRLPWPVFAKPVAEGSGKGVTASGKIHGPQELRAVCADLLERFRQPVLIETFLPGREFTVGIGGTGPEARVLGVMEVLYLKDAAGDVYGMENKEGWVGRMDYEMVDDPEAREAGDVALAAWRGLGCRDAGRIDIRQDADGRASFIEVNPLAGIRPGYSDLPIMCEKNGMPYAELIRLIVDSAKARGK